MDMTKWQKIGKFSDAVAYARSRGLGEVTYIGTVKLHGTNAGVRRTPDGRLIVQSRNRAGLDGGHLGFWQFVQERKDEIHVLFDATLSANALSPDTDVVLFGEWIGPGIQKGVAINQLPEKQWVLFGARLTQNKRQLRVLSAHPEAGIHNINYGPTFLLNVNFDATLAETTKTLTIWTLGVEQQCPWAEMFGIEGIGEGIVWKPRDEPFVHISDLWFKTKGEKHRGKKDRSGANTKVKDKPAVSDDVVAFVNEHLTERRLEQGLEALAEQGRSLTMRSTKSFLDAVLNDLRLETVNEREASALEWKPIGAFASRKAVGWFKERVNRVD